jgi:hypothetical protein
METYQQILAEQYAENAKDMLAYQQNTYYDEEPEVDEYERPSLRNQALEDQHAFKEFPGARNTEEIISKISQFEDKSKLSVRYNKDVKTNVFNIDSRFRSYALAAFNIVASNAPSEILLNSLATPALSTASRFVFRLSRMIKNAISVKLTSLEMPNVFANYASSRGNSIFRIKKKDDPKYRIVNIAPNNPDGSDAPLYISTVELLIQYVNNALAALDGPTTAPDYVSVYTKITCSLDSNGFIKITNASTTIDFIIDFHTQPLVSPELFVEGGAQEFDITYKYGKPQLFDTLGVTLGFPPVASGTIPLNKSSFITAYHPPDLNTDDYIYISINDYNTVTPQVVNDTYFTVFAKIPVQVEKYRMIFDTQVNNTTTKDFRFLQPTNIQQLEIRLLDMSGAELSFNNNYSMTIEIEEVVSHSLYEKMREM